MKGKMITFLAVIALVLMTLDLGARAGAFLLGSAPPTVSASGLSSTAAAQPASQPAGSGFTYQGKLLDNGQPVDGQYDFNFKLFDQPEGGTQIGSTVEIQGQTVTGGLFTVILDFGSEAFQGNERWLRIEVRPTGSGEYVILSPRQVITPTPYAIYAQSAQNAREAPWSGVTGKPWPYSPLRLPNNFSIADSQGRVGQYTSATIGVDGLPLVAYYDVTNGDLKVAHCNDIACTGRTISTVDSAGDVGRYASVTIGTDELPLISYFDASSLDLKVAHCDDQACTTATIAVLDSAGNVGQYSAITTGSDGLGLIGYYDSGERVKVAHCNDQECTGAGVVTLSRPNRVAEQMSVAVGGDGLPLVALPVFWPTGLNALVIVHCGDVTCSSSIESRIGACCRSQPAIPDSMPAALAIGPDGLGLIAFSGLTQQGAAIQSTLNIAHCSNADCTAKHFTTVKVGNDRPAVYATGLFASLSLRPNGLPSISFYDDPVQNHRLQLASCLDPLCDSAGISTLDSSGDVGRFTSLTMGMDGLPFVSYYDVTNGDLKLLHCGSAQCVPYQRQR